MTPWDRELDPALLVSGKPVQLYRSTRRQYATLSATGSAIYPGRWNQPGERAVYTSIEQSTPLLERLVHTGKGQIPGNLVMLTIALSGAWVPDGRDLRERETGYSMRVFSSLEEAETQFNSFLDEPGSGSHPFAIAVPSVILPVWNVILYPAEAGFREHVSIAMIEPFAFDPRLFPESAILESDL